MRNVFFTAAAIALIGAGTAMAETTVIQRDGPDAGPSESKTVETHTSSDGCESKTVHKENDMGDSKTVHKSDC